MSTKKISKEIKKKPVKTTKKSVDLNKIWDDAKGLLKEEFSKGLIQHPA